MAVAEAVDTILLSGNAQLTVVWADPSDNTQPAAGGTIAASGSAVTTYEVQHSTDGAAWASTGVTVDSAALTATITELANGTEHRVRVRATNSSGESPWSLAARATTGAPVAPAAPTLTSGDGKLTVSWTAPDDNGTTVHDYDVRCRRVGQKNWARVFDGGSTGLGGPDGRDAADDQSDPVDFGDFGSDVIISGAVDGNGGVYQVSEDIDEIYLYLQADIDNLTEDLGLSLRTSPSQPFGDLYTSGTELASATASAAQYGVAKFNKITVGPIAADGYFWTVPERSSEFGTRFRRIYGIDLATTSTDYELRGLADNTSYEVQIRASNTHGDSPWSASAEHTANRTSTKTTDNAPKSGPCYVPDISKIDELRNKFRRYGNQHPQRQKPNQPLSLPEIPGESFSGGTGGQSYMEEPLAITNLV